MLASTAVLVSLLWALVGADQVIRFRRDDTACRSGATWPEEFACLRAQNSLGRIIANIEIDKDTRRESLICRNFDKLPDSWPDDYFEADPNDVNVVCTSPRSILIDAIESIAGLDLVSIKGQIEACPKTSPNYHYCLCKWHVNTQHLRFMAKFFYQNDLWADMDFSCEKYLKKVGRGNIPHETIEDVPPEVVDDMPQEADDGPPLLNQTTYPDEMSTIPLARRGLAFKIVGGYPLYSNGQYGLPLPYQDTYYLYDERDAVKRCWIHPQLPVIASCTAWYLTASRTATAVYQERSVAVSYTADYTSSSSLRSTDTVPPVVTSIEPSALEVSTPTYASLTPESSLPSSTPTSTPTPTSASGAYSTKHFQGGFSLVFFFWVSLITSF